MPEGSWLASSTNSFSNEGSIRGRWFPDSPAQEQGITSQHGEASQGRNAG